MAATSVTLKGEIHDAVNGAWIEFGQFTLDPASVAAAAQGIETATIPGAKVGDTVFVNARDIEAQIALVGSKITSADTLSLYFNNMVDATTAINSGSKVYDYLLIHLT